MSMITIAGGLYHEKCAWPDWDHLFGSGGRAAAALSGRGFHVELDTYASEETSRKFEPYASMYGFDFNPNESRQVISFEYVHSMSTPVIRPVPSRIRTLPALDVECSVVLRFGMMEGSARVHAGTCVYDPQSAFEPEPFSVNGSHADRLAIVANTHEILALSAEVDLDIGARKLQDTSGAAVVIAKAGANGAWVFDASGSRRVSAFRSDPVWTIGSGDVFAAAFTAAWGIEHIDSFEAARLASVAVAEYASSSALPIRSFNELRGPDHLEVTSMTGEVYLAGAFFNMPQRWLVDEARRCLRQVGLKVFSPVHDVGSGRAHDVVPKDIEALERCDLVFALIDGIDSGTLFETGYARALKKPVYAFTQTTSDEDLKMMFGTDCRIYSDFVTAIHHAAWRT